MITFILVAILGVLLVIVLMNIFKKEPKPLPTPVRPVQDLANLKVTDARAGDVLSIVGAGDRMTDLDFTADRGARLDAGSRTWVELSGPYQERRVSLRVGGDEEIEVFLHADPRKVSLEDLAVTEDDLAQMDQRQNPSDSFEFDNATWLYRLSREVKACARQSAAAHWLLLLGISHAGRPAAAWHSQGRGRAVHRDALHLGCRGRCHRLPGRPDLMAGRTFDQRAYP
jgi:hypothetical protein